jgi:hypothetical protein
MNLIKLTKRINQIKLINRSQLFNCFQLRAGKRPLAPRSASGQDRPAGRASGADEF